MFSSLVVDDEIVSRLKMERYLSHHGPCQTVGSGLEALEAFKEAWANWTPIELMTLDVSMPEMDGAQTLIEIRNLEKEKGVSTKNRVKVLMVTGFSDRDTIMACVQGWLRFLYLKAVRIHRAGKKAEGIWLDFLGRPAQHC